MVKEVMGLSGVSEASTNASSSAAQDSLVCAAN